MCARYGEPCLCIFFTKNRTLAQIAPCPSSLLRSRIAFLWFLVHTVLGCLAESHREREAGTPHKHACMVFHFLSVCTRSQPATFRLCKQAHDNQVPGVGRPPPPPPSSSDGWRNIFLQNQLLPRGRRWWWGEGWVVGPSALTLSGQIASLSNPPFQPSSFATSP